MPNSFKEKIDGKQKTSHSLESEENSRMIHQVCQSLVDIQLDRVVSMIREDLLLLEQRSQRMFYQR